MRVVLDTNVVVSAHLKPTGVSARVLALVQAGTETTLLYDDRIIAEYREVLARKGMPAEHIEMFLSSLQMGGERILPHPVPVTSPDPDDQMFLEVAVVGRADALVTGNTRHFPAASCSVPVLSPAALLERLVR